MYILILRTIYAPLTSQAVLTVEKCKDTFHSPIKKSTDIKKGDISFVEEKC